MRTKTTLVATGTLAAVMALLLWRGGFFDAPSSTGSVAPSQAPHPEEPAPQRVLPEDSGQAPHSEDRKPIATAAAAKTDAGTEATTDGVPNLIVRVVLEKSGEAVAGAMVHGSVDPRDRGPDDGPVMVLVRDMPRTDEHGMVRLRVATGARIDVFATSEASWSGHGPAEVGTRTVAVEPLLPGEVREVVVELPHGRDLSFFGRAISESTGAPIPGAIVCQLGDEAPPPHRAIDPSDLIELVHDAFDPNYVQATSHASGLFELRTRSWDPGAFVLVAPDHGPRFFAPTPEHRRAEAALDLPLLASAMLRVRVIDAAGDATLRVVLRTEGYEMAFPADSFGEAFDDVEPKWLASLDATGRGAFVGLPARVPFHIDIERGGRVARTIGEPLTLEPGEVRDVEWRIGSSGRIFGTATDQHGRPAESIALWLIGDEHVHARWGASCVLESYQDEEVSACAKTNERGEFEFQGVASGRWWVGPAPHDRYGAPADADAPSPIAVAVEVPVEGGERRIALTLTTGAFISGRVLSPDGSGVQAFLSARHTESGLWFDGESEVDGTFRIGPLLSGDFSLQASAYGLEARYADSLPVPARAGDREVKLALREGGRLAGRVVDATTAEGCSSELLFSSPNDPTNGMTSITEEDGSFDHGALLPGSYDIVAVADSRVGFVRGVEVRAGNAVDDLRIELRPGARLRVRFDGEQGPRNIDVLHECMLVAVSGPQAGPSYDFSVPAGKVIVRISVDELGPTQELERELAAGGLEEIVFPPGD